MSAKSQLDNLHHFKRNSFFYFTVFTAVAMSRNLQQLVA